MFFGAELIQLKKKSTPFPHSHSFSKDPVSIMWMAGLRNRLSKRQVLKVDLKQFGSHLTQDDRITHPLRITGTLLLGLVVIYKRQTDYLIAELKAAMDRVRFSDSETLTSSINLPEGRPKNKHVLSDPDESLALLLDEAHNNSLYFSNPEFNRNLKALLESGFDTQFGFPVEFLLGMTPEPTVSPSRGAIDRLSGMSQLDDILAKKAPCDPSQEMVDDEVIDFEMDPIVFDAVGDVGGGDEIRLEDLEGGSIREEMEGLNAREAKKSRKRKRALVDHPTQIATSFIRQALEDTSDHTNPRSTNRGRSGGGTISTKEIWGRPLAFGLRTDRLPADVLAEYKSSIANSAAKRRKIDDRTPEILRSADQGADVDEMMFDVGGGDEITLEDLGDDDDVLRFGEPKVKKPKRILRENDGRPSSFERELLDRAPSMDLDSRPSNIERTAWAFFQFLKARFDELNERPISLERALDTRNRAIAAKGFHSTLMLAGGGMISAKQDRPFGKIWLDQGSQFHEAGGW